MPIAINTKILNYRITGAQRYLLEILKRLPQEQITIVNPATWCSGGVGHLWEQTILPLRLDPRALLWSPSITGPLVVDRQVVTIFDVVPLDHPEWCHPAFVAFYRFVVPRLARQALHIITISEYTKSRIVEVCGVPPEKVTVTLLAADARFNPQAADPARIASLALPSPRYVLALGSIEPRKNLPRLIQAWGRAAPRIPEDTILVVAGGQGRRSIFGDHALGQVPQRVHFTGHVADDLLPALLANAVGFCYPSSYEGFGLPPLEAMASGVPVITSGMTSLAEVVGDTGLQIDPFQVEDIATALERLCGDEHLRDELRRKGLERSRAFSWDLAARQTWEVLTREAAG